MSLGGWDTHQRQLHATSKIGTTSAAGPEACPPCSRDLDAEGPVGSTTADLCHGRIRPARRRSTPAAAEGGRDHYPPLHVHADGGRKRSAAVSLSAKAMRRRRGRSTEVLIRLTMWRPPSIKATSVHRPHQGIPHRHRTPDHNCARWNGDPKNCFRRVTNPPLGAIPITVERGDCLLRCRLVCFVGERLPTQRRRTCECSNHALRRDLKFESLNEFVAPAHQRQLGDVQ